MKKGEKYRLQFQDFSIGILTIEKIESNSIYGLLELNEKIKKKLGRGRTFSNVFEKYSNYCDILYNDDLENKDEYLAKALVEIEAGEVSNYLQSKDYFIISANGEISEIELQLFFSNGQFCFDLVHDNVVNKIIKKLKKNKDNFKETNYPFCSYRAGELGAYFKFNKNGTHQIGGISKYKGIFPKNSDVSLHHLLTIDLADLNSPFYYKEKEIRYLPLFYPLAYDNGGAEAQYEITADDEIKIIYMSNDTPDEEPYIEVKHLPLAYGELIPLQYAEKRMRIMDQSFCEMDQEDDCLRDKLGGNSMICFEHDIVGDYLDMEQICRNSQCLQFEQIVTTELLTIFPALPINGENEFWYDYDTDVDFCFVMCPYCRTIITFNRCT